MISKATIVFLLVALFPVSAYSRILMVAQDGTEEFVDIRKALQTAESGDEIMIKEGQYKGGLTIRQSNISIVGRGAEFTKIKAVNEPVVSIENAAGIILEGLAVETRSYTGHSTVYAENAGLEIRNCLVSSEGKAYGIYCLSRTEAKIINNTIVFHRKGGINFDGSCSMVIKKNILAFNRYAVVNIDDTFAKPVIEENILWKNQRNYQRCDSGTGNRETDPQFLSSSTGDYRLKATSPALSGKAQVIGSSQDMSVVEKPELALVVEKVEDDDYSGRPLERKEIKLRVMLSNSERGYGRNLELKISNNLPGFPPFKKNIKEIKPVSSQIIEYKFPVPEETPDSIVFKVSLQSIYNYQVEPVIIQYEFKPELNFRVELLESQNNYEEVFGGGKIGFNIILANSQKCAGRDIEIKLASDLPETDIYRKTIDKIGRGTTKILQYYYKIPMDVRDSDMEITVSAQSKHDYQLEPVLLNFKLKSILAELKIETEPEGVEILINGRHRETSPAVIDDVLPGRSELILRKENYDDERRILDLQKREERFIEVALRKSRGDLKVVSRPSGAFIKINGRVRGKTPVTISSLTVGNYRISALNYTPESAHIFRGEVMIKKGENNFSVDSFKKYPVPSGMAVVSGGEFLMGSKQGERDERPEHKVYVDPFYMDIHEVSVKEFKQYLKTTGHSLDQYITENRFQEDSLPMTGVSWNDAQKYARWAGKRLPREAEWELAAKGNSSRKWPWGNDFSLKYANTVGETDGYPKLAPVTAFPPGKSVYGILNMAGNVWEWCSDGYNSSYYADSPYMNPPGPEPAGDYRVLRGGSWSYGRFDARCSNRFRLKPNLRRNYVGLRLVFVPGER
ncbi:MAG: SUMF1/EgtB/PvdO family nonheme iron enzyme [bacterium]